MNSIHSPASVLRPFAVVSPFSQKIGRDHLVYSVSILTTSVTVAADSKTMAVEMTQISVELSYLLASIKTSGTR